MKNFICRKAHLCEIAECGHKYLHTKDEMCEFSYCPAINKNVSCKEVKKEIKEEVKK